jgi:hypothetical protein
MFYWITAFVITAIIYWYCSGKLFAVLRERYSDDLPVELSSGLSVDWWRIRFILLRRYNTYSDSQLRLFGNLTFVISVVGWIEILIFLYVLQQHNS